MGNSPSNGGLRLGNGDRSYSTYANGSTTTTINFRGRTVQQLQNGEIIETWIMFYNAAGMFNCNFCLSKSLAYNPYFIHPSQKLTIIIEDNLAQGLFVERFVVTVEKLEHGTLFHNLMGQINFGILTNVNTIATNANGDIVELGIDMYGTGPLRGLLIREWKRRGSDKQLHTGTVAHYYVNVANGQDVGLSVMIKKIKVMENGQLDYAVDGPEQHPVGALCYMFNEVVRTRTWKPTLCPHCACKYIQDRQSDTESDIANFPAAPSHEGSWRKGGGGGLINNDGTFKGNHNGNTFIKNFFSGRKAR